MNSLLSVLMTKRFSVLVQGEFERTTNFLGLMRLLAKYGDFFDYASQEQLSYLSKFVTSKEAYIDANINVRFK